MTSLRFVGLKPQSLKSYKAALKNFFDWLDDEDLPLPSTSRQLDESLAAFLEHLWLDDISITYAGHTLSALRRFYPQLRYKMPVARQFFSNWKSVHTPKQAVPMPASVALALAGVAFSVHEISLGFLILLGFLAFLRTGEITSLTANRVQAHPETGQIILALPATKTSKQKLESVQVEDINLAILAQHVLAHHPGGVIGTLTPNLFRAKMKLMLAVLELTPHNFTGYSLRRGGASHAFTQGQHFDSLLVKGRWQSIKTARQYLDSGRASLVHLQFSEASTGLIVFFQQKASDFCDQLRKRRT